MELVSYCFVRRHGIQGTDTLYRRISCPISKNPWLHRCCSVNVSSFIHQTSNSQSKDPGLFLFFLITFMDAEKYKTT